MARRVFPSAPSLSPLSGGRRVRKHRSIAPLLGGGLVATTAVAAVLLTFL